MTASRELQRAIAGITTMRAAAAKLNNQLGSLPKLSGFAATTGGHDSLSSLRDFAASATVELEALLAELRALHATTDQALRAGATRLSA